MKKEIYQQAVKKAHVPLLVLDQKWHQIFLVRGKPGEVQAKEKELNELLAEQGRLNSELKDLKKVKQTLMDDIVGRMGSEDQQKTEQDKKLIDEANERMEADEERLAELPGLIRETNDGLMTLTMEFCYDSFRSNTEEIRRIADWISQVRRELKVNVIKKQNREINTRQMYAYMNDIFGPEIVNVFDLENDDVLLDFHEEDRKQEMEQQEFNKKLAAEHGED